MQVGCNAHAFGGNAKIYMRNDRPLDDKGRRVAHEAHLSWDFVKVREQHTWKSGDLEVDVVQAVERIEAASPSIEPWPTESATTVHSCERRTVVCIDPLVAICDRRCRKVELKPELRTTSVAFVQYGVGTLRLPMGYSAGTRVELPSEAEWLILEGEVLRRACARDGAGKLHPLELAGLTLELRPLGGARYRVVGSTR